MWKVEDTRPEGSVKGVFQGQGFLAARMDAPVSEL